MGKGKGGGELQALWCLVSVCLSDVVVRTLSAHALATVRQSVEKVEWQHCTFREYCTGRLLDNCMASHINPIFFSDLQILVKAAKTFATQESSIAHMHDVSV